MLIHLRPEAHFVEGAIQLDVVLRALDEHHIAVSWASNALVANRLARNLHSGTRELEPGYEWRAVSLGKRRPTGNGV